MSDKVQIGPVPYEVYRAQQQNDAIQEAVALEMDKTVPGGRYLVGDQLVNADGEPINDRKQAAKADDK